MTNYSGHNGIVPYNVAQAKTHLSEILDRVSEGEHIILTRRGKPIAKVVPMERVSNILGDGKQDLNINREVLDQDDWWKAMPENEVQDWYG